MNIPRLLILAILNVSVYNAAANLLVNPGFELPGGTSDFTNSNWTAGGSATAGREIWATRSGVKGGYAPGWSGPNDSFVYQDVPVTTGTYTFSIWVRHESGHTALTNEVRIGWYDANTNLLQESKATFPGMVSDNLSHPLYVTDSCSSQILAFARATYYAAYGTPGAGNQATFFDDAEFYAGPHAGTPLSNGSFVLPVPTEDNYWRASQWHNLPDLGTNKYYFEPWASHSGTNGIGLWGWDVADPSNSVTIAQNLATGTGTFSFVCYLNREPDFNLTNAQLRIEWFDKTFTNKVCPDAVTNLTVPNDYAWHEYGVVGSCDSNNLYETRVSVFVEWGQNTNPGIGHALKVDDARFLPGVYNGVSLTENWSYHGAPGSHPSLETIPGTNLDTFLQVDYNSKTSTFYVMTPAEDFALYPGEGGQVGLRTTFQRPENGQFVTAFSPMTPIGLLTINNVFPFQGQPAVGVQTQRLWCFAMEFPRDTNGVIYTTNTITVFYSPYLRTTNELGGETDVRYLVRQDGESTNNLRQLFAESPEFKDYSFPINPFFYSQLMDPGFETPAANNFVGSPWQAFNSIGHETWATRTGAWGGYFPSWDPGNGIIFQDVAAIGTTYTYSLWVKRMLGAVLNTMELKIEWFNTAAQLMYAATNLVTLPADERWHRICLTSTLPAGTPLFARPALYADFGDGTLPFHESILFDDAEFYSGGFTSVQPFLNGGFEQGAGGFVDSYWDAVLTDYVGRDGWAFRTGSWGADFQGFVTGQPAYEGTLSQPLNISTGTYVFSAWIQAEDSILLTNFQMEIEWLKKDLTSSQPATVVPLTVPLDNTWHYYAITGTCGNADLFEVRPLFRAQWDENLGGGNKAIKIDDVGFGPPGDLDDDGDGLPNAWESLYFGGPTNADANSNGDGDAALNWEEYVADTHPTNGASYFPNVITNLSGSGTFTLYAGPPTTNSRIYDAWYNTNLISGAWVPLGYNLPGNEDGSAVVIVVTNNLGAAYYITGVKLP